MGKKKVFIDAGPLLNDKLSGVGHYTLLTIRTLSNNQNFLRSHELYLLAPARKTHLLKQWQLQHTRIISIPLLARIWNVWPRIRFAPPIDLFLGKGIYLFPNYKRWPLLFSPSITWVYDIAFKFFPDATEPRNLKMLENNLGRWIQKSTRIATISESSKNEIIEYFPAAAQKTEMLYCGVDNALFYPRNEAEVTEVKNRYGITKKYFFFLSNLEPRKNIERLIKAFTMLPASYKKQYSLVLVGGMAWRSEPITAAIKAAQQEGWDIIKPQKYVPDEDLPKLLSGAEALVHPALHEGFGLSPLQAMACGTPVIVSDIPVLHEVVGDSGLYIDPCNEAELSTTMRRLLDDNRLQKEFAAKGQERAKQFSWDEPVSRLADSIEHIETGRKS